jgi:hypothetical protein
MRPPPSSRAGAVSSRADAKTRLKRLRYRPELLAGFLGQIGLVLEPVPP